jgi:hypothetical protein
VQPVRAYQVKIEGDTILVAPAAPSPTHEAREPTVAR